MLNEGDVLSLYFSDEFFKTDSSFTAGNSDIDVVYEDENIIVINKSAGIVVHADDKDTADTLLYRMQSYLYEKGEYNPENEHSFSPAFANRLDRNTAGLIIGAKNAEALRILNEKIRTREVKKYYLAVCEGKTDKEGTLTAYLTRGDKMVSVSDIQSENSKLIKTAYKTLETRGNVSLVEIELLTGRTHQIRAQMAHIGHPLRGDKKYGSASKGKITLVSYKLQFDFVTPAGTLDYLNDREIGLHVDIDKLIEN